jgi:hypothetical protein
VTTDLVEPAATVKPKPRWWMRILVIVLAVAAFAGLAELGLRAIIPNVIAGLVRDNLHLKEDHPVEVELGGSVLLHTITGRVGDVTMQVPGIKVLDGIEADLSASAASIPFNPTAGEMKGVTASATIPSKDMSALVSLVSDGALDEGTVRNGEIELGRTMEMFGWETQIAASLALSIQNGDVLVSPTEIKAAGFDLSAEQLRPMLGETAAALLDTHTVCVRDRLPAGITLTDIDLRANSQGGSATVTASLAPDLLSNPKQMQPGSCGAP